METQYAPVGELESVELIKGDSGSMVHVYGTAEVISPCYIITNHHVVFPLDPEPVPGKDYSMTFRVGLPPGPDIAFLGKTIATPVVRGNYGAAHSNDWVIMKLKACIGGVSKLGIGWFEVADLSPKAIEGMSVSVVGYTTDSDRGVLSFSSGTATKFDLRSGMMKYSASAIAGQSGGGVFVHRNGDLQLVGMHTFEFSEEKSGRFATYSDDHTNEFTLVRDVVMRPDIKFMLDQDKAKVGGVNPRKPSPCFLVD